MIESTLSGQQCQALFISASFCALLGQKRGHCRNNPAAIPRPSPRPRFWPPITRQGSRGAFWAPGFKALPKKSWATLVGFAAGCEAVALPRRQQPDYSRAMPLVRA